jgi:hypothetical protein
MRQAIWRYGFVFKVRGYAELTMTEWALARADADVRAPTCIRRLPA